MVNPVWVACNTVARFDNYQRPVDRHSDDGFPVDKLNIIGSDLRLAERVVGRMARPGPLAHLSRGHYGRTTGDPCAGAPVIRLVDLPGKTATWPPPLNPVSDTGLSAAERSRLVPLPAAGRGYGGPTRRWVRR